MTNNPVELQDAERAVLLHIADALDCFWNAAIGEAHNRQSSAAMDTASVMAEGLAAISTRLKERAAQTMTINKEQAVSDALSCPKCGKHWRDVTLPENASEVLDAFYAAIPEKFGTCMPDDRHATAAASIPLADDDRMWLRGIAAAIEAYRAWEHPLAKMVRLDEEMGLYDDESIAPASHPLEQQQAISEGGNHGRNETT